MSPNTGEVVATLKMSPTELSELQKKGFLSTPESLQKEAKDLLNGKRNAFVNLQGKSGLARWAKKKRRQQKASRRNNRR